MAFASQKRRIAALRDRLGAHEAEDAETKELRSKGYRKWAYPNLAALVMAAGEQPDKAAGDPLPPVEFTRDGKGWPWMRYTQGE